MDREWVSESRCSGDRSEKLIMACRYLRLAMLLMFTALIVVGGAQAQQAEQQDFNIPGGSLASALNRLADETDLQLIYDTALAQGLRTPGVSGTYTPEQALQRLLAGTGLSYRFTNADTVTLERAVVQDEGEPMQLSPIVVEGWRSTEIEGYRAEVISSATKTDALLIDVPASVSVVTEEVIEDQRATSVTEALRNVPGVGTGPNPANVSVQEEVTIRGFESLLVHVNGVQRRSTGPLSTANIASVEVLKGPLSVLYGDLSPGGFVNIQTKRPQPKPSYEVALGLLQVTEGRGTEGRGSVDFTGPLTADGSFLYRFIASADGGSSFIEDVENEQYLIAPSLSFIGLDKDLRLDFDFRYLRNEGTFLFGIPSRGDRPETAIDHDSFLGADESEKVTEDFSAELRGEYAVGTATTIDAALTYHLNDHFSSALRPFGPPGQQIADDDTVRRSFSLRSFDTEDLQFEANIIHNVDVGPTSWRLLAGGDVRRTTLDDEAPGGGNIVDFDRVNVFDPDTGVDLPSNDDPRISFFPFSDQTVDAFGGYVQAETWIFDRLKLLAGVSYSNNDFRFEDEAGFEFDQEDDEFSPRFGVLYKLTPSTSLYASYSTSFQQELSFDPGTAFEPTEADQIEAGIKQEFFDGRAFASLSMFEITQENLVQPDPNDPFRSIQIGEAETRGVELDIRGEVLPGLNVIAGYAFLDNEITEATDGTEGNRLPNVPEHEASLWLTYDLLERKAERVTLGGGVFYESDRFTSTQNGVEMSDYITADLTAQYSFVWDGLDLQAQAGLKNIFDEEYFISGFGEGIAFRGQPRTFFLQLKGRF